MRVHADGVIEPVKLHDGAIVGCAHAHPGMVRVDAPGISVAHARFSVRWDGVYLEDLETGHTRVDGISAGTVPLVHGSVVRLGEMLAVFVERGLSTFSGSAARLGDLVVGPAQRWWVDQLHRLVADRQSFVIEGAAGVGKCALARVCIKLVDARSSCIIDGHDPVVEPKLRAQMARAARLWVVLHLDHLERSVQSDLARHVKRTSGVMLVATMARTGPSWEQTHLTSPMQALLSGHRLTVPSLDDRREDIVAIARALCERRRLPPETISLDMGEELMRGGWPMGVRGLDEVLGEVLNAQEVPKAIRGRVNRPAYRQPLSLQASDPELARARLKQALAKASGTVSLAARELGMSRQSFYREMKRLDVPLPRKAAASHHRFPSSPPR